MQLHRTKNWSLVAIMQLIGCNFSTPSSLNNNHSTRHGLYKVISVSLIFIHSPSRKLREYCLRCFSSCSRLFKKFSIGLKSGDFDGQSRCDDNLEFSLCHSATIFKSMNYVFFILEESEISLSCR